MAEAPHQGPGGNEGGPARYTRISFHQLEDVGWTGGKTIKTPKKITRVGEDEGKLEH